MIDVRVESADQVPELSIVIPAYNVAPFITQAVASALDQSFANIEVIVIDDGSTDGTDAILAAFARERADTRLHIIRQPNAGLSGARNSGIAAARGTFIGFLDGDDMWMPHKAACHVTALRTDPGVGISFSNSAYVTESGAESGSLLLADKTCPTLHDMIRRNQIGNGSTAVVRRMCFEEAGVFREDLRACEDYELWCRILWLTPYRAELVPEPLTWYRMRLDSLSYDHTKFVVQADAAMRSLRDAMRHVPPRIFDAGHAEHYRIAAWKAASRGDHAAGSHLLLHAVKLHPALMLDRRAVAAGIWLMLPRFVRRWLAPRLGIGQA